MMDIDEALRHHLEWKIALRWMLCGHQPIDAERLARDDVCELGRWLAGEAGARFRGSLALERARRAHSEFHRACAAVIQRSADGDPLAASALLDPGGAFSTASEEIAAALQALKRSSSAPPG